MPQRERQVAKEPLKPEDARWIKLMKCTYTDPAGEHRTWESAERTTRPATSNIDAVDIFAFLKRPNNNNNNANGNDENAYRGPEIVLQKQYRPPADRVMIEAPAGLIDEGETPEQCAIRELKEETGFIGKATGRSPMMFNDPGLSNSCLNAVYVDVDMSLPENQHPMAELEEGEFIETFTVPIKDLSSKLKQLATEGYGVDARIGTLAEGIQIAKSGLF